MIFVWLLWVIGLLHCGAVLLEPFSTDPPPFEKAEHPLKPSSLLSPLLKAPYPTNEWWQDAILEDGSNPIIPEPYHVQLLNDGVLMALNSKVVSANTWYMFTAFRFGLKLLLGSHVSHEIFHYDQMSVSARYNDSKTKAPLATIPIVRGSAFITAVYQQPASVVVDMVGCAIVNVQSNKNPKKAPPNTATGTVFTVSLNTSQTWLVFSDKQVTLKWTPLQLTSSAPVHAGTVLRFAAVPAGASVTATSTLMAKYSHCVPLAGSVDSDVLDQESITTVEWKTLPPGSKPCAPLIVALPHLQGLLSKRTHTFTSLKYDGLLGTMVAIASTTWAWRMPLANISWFSPEPIHENMRDALAQQVAKDTKNVGFAPEPYAFGKQVCRFARVSLIAEQLGLTEVMNKADAVIKEAFGIWMGGEGSDALVFDKTWYGTVPSNGLDSPGADFGAGYYNDHHFHYGYWLYAAAAASRHDAQWGQKYLRHFKALARDIANPSSDDPYYPVFRYFDWYAGHSWASGLMAFNSGRNQESTSEAINAWYAMQLYGDAVGDISLKKTGQLLLAHEMEAARVYWRSTSTQSVYPAALAQHKGIGMVWENKVDVSTWFGAGPVYALTINILPYTPITEAYLRKDWVKEALPILEEAVSKGDYIDDWKVIIYMAQAQIDPKAAWNTLQKISVRSDEGMTLSNVMWWIATRPDPSKPDPPLPQPLDVLPVAHHSPRPTMKLGDTAPEIPMEGSSKFEDESSSDVQTVARHIAFWLGTAAMSAGAVMMWIHFKRGQQSRQDEGAMLMASHEPSYHT